MEKLKKKIKMYSLKVTILWLTLAIIIFVFLLINSINPKSLTSYCQVYNDTDLNKCYQENPYVEIHGVRVYDGEYDYIHNKKTVARFSTIELKGYTTFMAALIEPSKAKKLIDEESEDIVIRGKLEKFDTGAKQKGYNAMKELYVRYLKDSATREEVLNNFTLLQLNQYSSSKITLYMITTTGLAFTGLFLFLAFKQSKYFFHVENYPLNKNIKLKDTKEVEKIIKELESNQYDFHKKDIYVTKNYLICKTGGIAVAERKNIAWIYEKIIKQNGITTGKNWLVYSTDRKVPFSFTGGIKKHDEMGRKLKELFPNAIFGYSNELASLWNKNPEQFFKEEKKVKSNKEKDEIKE